MPSAQKIQRSPAQIAAINETATVVKQTLADAIAVCLAGDVAVGNGVEWREHHADTGIGGNVGRLMDAGTAGARPAEDGGSVIHVGSDGLWLKGLFLDGWYRISQFGGVPDGVTDNFNAFNALLQGDRNVIIDKGVFYIDGDGSVSPLIEWFGLSRQRYMIGHGHGVSQIKCSSSVMNLLAVTGVSIDGIGFDGGFDPSVSTANLKPLLVLNENTSFTNCKVRNTYGSNIFSKFGPCVIDGNDLGNYGDHAFYVSADDTVESETKDIRFSNNIISQDPSYTNDFAVGQREAIKIRNKVTTVKIVENVARRVAIAVRFEADTYPADDVVIRGNSFFCEFSPAASSENYYGVSFATAPTNVRITENFFKGAEDGNGQGLFANAPVTDVIFRNNTVTGFNIGMQSSGADNFAFCTVEGCKIDCPAYAIFQLGKGTVISNNKVTSGIRDKHGNEIESNDIDMGGAGDAVLLVVESDAAQPRRKIRFNKIRNADRGVYLSNLSNGIGMELTNNEFFECSGSVVVVNSDAALRASEYYGNRNITGVGSFQSGFPQGARLGAYGGLPTAGEEYRGVQAIRVVGDVDTLYTCLKTGASTYSWVQSS